MGKKSRIFYFSVLFVNIVCFVLDLLPIDFPFFRISFAVSLILIGILLLIRAFGLKIDSSMFFGFTLFGCGVINFVLYFLQTYLGVDQNQFWPYYFFVLAIASMITAIYFKDKLQAKLFVLFLGFGFISLIFVQNLINVYVFVALLALWFILYFVINIIIAKRRKK